MAPTPPRRLVICPDKQRRFVRLVFPIVVSVEGRELAPLSHLREHFGGEVSELDDLPSRKDGGSFDTEIAALVTEVESTGKAAKRGALIAPRGADHLFDCSVCALVWHLRVNCRGLPV